MAAISWRQRAIHATFLSLAISSKVLPLPSSLAFLPLSVCHRCTITSTYLRVQLQAEPNTLGEFRGSESGSRSQERVTDHLATLQVVQDGPAHQFNRLLRGVIVLFFIRSAHDELRDGDAQIVEFSPAGRLELRAVRIPVCSPIEPPNRTPVLHPSDGLIKCGQVNLPAKTWPFRG
jgi:hypothetical protein